MGVIPSVYQVIPTVKPSGIPNLLEMYLKCFLDVTSLSWNEKLQ